MKMENNNIWPNRSYVIDSDILDSLLNDEFDIVNTLQADFGSGMVLSYKKGAQIPAKYRKKSVVIIELPEQAGYDSLTMPVDLLPNPFTRLPISKTEETKADNENSSVDKVIAETSENYNATPPKKLVK